MPRWLVGRCWRIGAHDQELGRKHTEAPDALHTHLSRPDAAPPLAVTFYRRDVLQQVGSFNGSLRFAFGYELTARLLAMGEQPMTTPCLLAAHRQDATPRPLEALLQRGREVLETAHRFAGHLPLGERYALWRVCDERQQVYAQAEEASAHSAAARLRWRRLLEDPACLRTTESRHALLQASPNPDQPTSPRSAA